MHLWIFSAEVPTHTDSKAVGCGFCEMLAVIVVIPKSKCPDLLFPRIGVQGAGTGSRLIQSRRQVSQHGVMGMI